MDEHIRKSMIKKIDHIGIAVKNIEEQLSWYRDVLGFELLGIENVESQKVRVAFFAIGGVHLELLEPTSPESPIAKFLEKRGTGVHHISYEVDDVQKAIDYLQKNSVQMIDIPRAGANNLTVAFVHPKASQGILTELCAHQHEH